MVIISNHSCERLKKINIRFKTEISVDRNDYIRRRIAFFYNISVSPDVNIIEYI